MVTRPYLNLLVKPRIYFRFSGKKNIILCILKGKIAIFFQKKKINEKIVCLPYLKFSDPLPETHLFFFWPHRVKTLQEIIEEFNYRQNLDWVNHTKGMDKSRTP